MSYRVLARKYRPQRFQEVVGQEHITQTLQNAITTGRLAQAYLFVGPRGVGKTSTARIFAKALNCHEGPTINPCGKCDACLEIAEGRNLDVLEIDGASNNSVESIRTLRENAAFAPTHGPFKIYLIDEVHMLTTAAFNALLKTLEEPPAHVKFLFATTEAQKLPATITSRCQRFDLRRISESAIAKHLLDIALKENISLTPKAASNLAHSADGALRDAESIFDQVISFCGTTITEEDVQNILGLTSQEIMQQLGDAIFSYDAPTALALVTEQSEAGKDLARLLNDLIGFLHTLLIQKSHPSAERTSISDAGSSISSEKLLTLLDYLGESANRLHWATDKKLQLEVAIIKAIHLLQEVSLSDVLDALSSIREGAPLPEITTLRKPPTTEKKPTPLIKAPSVLEKKTSTAVEPSIPIEKPPILKIAPDLALETASKKNEQISSEDLWKNVAKLLADESPLKFGWLASGKFLEQSGNKISVEFSSSHSSQTETLFWHQAHKKIQEQLSTALGVKVDFIPLFTGAALPEEPAHEPLLEEKSQAREPVSKTASSSSSSTKTAETSKHPVSVAAPVLTPEELEAFKNDPLIKKALEIFQAEIVV